MVAGRRAVSVFLVWIYCCCTGIRPTVFAEYACERADAHYQHLYELDSAGRMADHEPMVATDDTCSYEHRIFRYTRQPDAGMVDCAV